LERPQSHESLISKSQLASFVRWSNKLTNQPNLKITMQTSFMIADRRFQECEPGALSLPLPQFPEREREAGQSNVSRLTFLTRPRNREAVTAGKIDQSITYMTQHLNQPLQVSTLAAMVNISPSHYFALFKRRTGRAPMDYFTRLRMEQARRLLDTTTSSVKEVAAALGYDDPFYFSRVFKSVNQLAPSNYRIKQKIASEPGEDSPFKS
jgi:AraC-like DNA-binding protein